MDEIFGDYYDIQYSNKCMYHFLAYGDPYKNSKKIKIVIPFNINYNNTRILYNNKTPLRKNIVKYQLL